MHNEMIHPPSTKTRVNTGTDRGTTLIESKAAEPSGGSWAPIALGSKPIAAISRSARLCGIWTIALSTSAGATFKDPRAEAISAARSRISRASRVSAMSAEARSSSVAASGIRVIQFRKPLPHHLVKEGGRGRRGVEACHVPNHGQTHPSIASLLDQPVHAGPLAADHDAHPLGEVELPRPNLAARVEGNAPDAGPLHVDDRRRES